MINMLRIVKYIFHNIKHNTRLSRPTFRDHTVVLEKAFHGTPMSGEEEALR